MRKYRLNHTCDVPLLLCLPSLERMAEVVNQLDQYQREHYQSQLKIDIFDTPRVEINAPDYDELHEIEIEREMRRPPHKPKKVR